ncbi:Uncharacterized protein YijF [hydrothermal vent metagenome]|uniref:Uncharacterized protein YijF n=1 Tax=hydrothermal vent metagenome TaxID=652676 RepID=A0A3B1CSB6_9ZZZZ
MNIKYFLILVGLLSLSTPAQGDVIRDRFVAGLVQAAKERTLHDVTYDGSYFSISYPNGDVPANIGVCTDVVIRSFRKVGVDLQQKVHEDMLENFDLYPSKKIWDLNRPDKNIDHRRVPNLRIFFERFGHALVITRHAKDYLPGDLVTWMLPKNLPHIGIVIDKKSDDGKRPLIAHNIGKGPKINDILFDYQITGHYRYTGE